MQPRLFRPTYLAATVGLIAAATGVSAGLGASAAQLQVVTTTAPLAKPPRALFPTTQVFVNRMPAAATAAGTVDAATGASAGVGASAVQIQTVPTIPPLQKPPRSLFPTGRLFVVRAPAVYTGVIQGGAGTSAAIAASAAQAQSLRAAQASAAAIGTAAVQLQTVPGVAPLQKPARILFGPLQLFTNRLPGGAPAAVAGAIDQAAGVSAALGASAAQIQTVPAIPPLLRPALQLFRAGKLFTVRPPAVYAGTTRLGAGVSAAIGASSAQVQTLRAAQATGAAAAAAAVQLQTVPTVAPLQKPPRVLFPTSDVFVARRLAAGTAATAPVIVVGSEPVQIIDTGTHRYQILDRAGNTLAELTQDEIRFIALDQSDVRYLVLDRSGEKLLARLTPGDFARLSSASAGLLWSSTQWHLSGGYTDT